jgi:hypothetical protein
MNHLWRLAIICLLTSPVLGQTKKFDVVIYGGTAGGVWYQTQTKLLRQ